MRESKELKIAARYRQRAAQLRAAAAENVPEEAREKLLNSAADYERGAAMMVSIDETKKELARFKISS